MFDKLFFGLVLFRPLTVTGHILDGTGRVIGTATVDADCLVLPRATPHHKQMPDDRLMVACAYPSSFYSDNSY